MKPNGLLQAELQGILARIGHTQTIVISDAGLPVPQGVKVIDMALTSGVPGFIQVLQAVFPECVFESCVVAEEIKDRNPAMLQRIQTAVGSLPIRCVSHELFKQMSCDSLCIVRTGETSPYSNIILVGGVNF